jgi:hypothetical protein
MTKPNNLYETCERIYTEGGQDAVFRFILAEHPEVKWGWCEPCEINSPADSADQMCLVCGSPTTQAQDELGQTA